MAWRLCAPSQVHNRHNGAITVDVRAFAERSPRRWSSDSDRRFRRILSDELCRAAPFDVLVRSANVAHLRAKLQCLARACGTARHFV